MSTQTVFLPFGMNNLTVDIALVQNAGAASPGNPLTGLAFNTASLTCFQRNGPTSASVAIALVTQTPTGAWTAGGFCAADATNMPGSYRFDLPNNFVPASGEMNIVFNGAAGLATHTLKVIPVQQFMLGRMIETYPTVGVAPNPSQALFDIRQLLYELSFSGTTGTIKKLDHTTVAHTVTINDPSNPTSITQAT